MSQDQLDRDPQETQEWQEAIDVVVERSGADRARCRPAHTGLPGRARAPRACHRRPERHSDKTGNPRPAARRRFGLHDALDHRRLFTCFFR